MKDKLLAAKITQKIIRYLERGALLGPFDVNEIPWQQYFLNPLTGLWKIPGEKATVIQNLSAPDGNSINSSIPKELRKTDYITFEQLIRIAFSVGIGGYLWIIDLKDSYFSIPVLRQYYKLFGSEWFGKYIFYACLPFGLATAPKVFTLFADSLQYIEI